MNYLYAAYFAAWAVHIVYLVSLTRGYKKVAEEIQDLNRR